MHSIISCCFDPISTETVISVGTDEARDASRSGSRDSVTEVVVAGGRAFAFSALAVSTESTQMCVLEVIVVLKAVSEQAIEADMGEPDQAERDD
jgi:hypothetical protein